MLRTLIRLNFLPWILLGKFLGWLFRHRILTVPRIIVLLLLPVWAFIDFIGIVPVYMAPKTVLPPIQPEMSWEQVFNYLNSVPPGMDKPVWWTMTIELFAERPAGFWLAQIPFALVLGVLGLVFWRTGWPYKKAETHMTGEITYGSSRWLKKKNTGGRCSRFLPKNQTNPG
ncbi:MAG: hypothetical protein H0Z35_07860 [Thermoanaerobacteraceae bacterium]|nr:hypothetical protein [Thermoanaerobacteraceae bacterium]